MYDLLLFMGFTFGGHCIMTFDYLFQETSPKENLLDSVRCAMDMFGTFEPCPKIAVACSGGADSVSLLVALCHLVKVPHTPLTGGTIVAVHVNHGLRHSAGQDADFLATLCQRLGIEYHILQWHHDGINSRIQEKARHARYDLLGDWCRHNGILHLCIAHHNDDQQETIFMRQQAKSGSVGLAGMDSCMYRSWGRLLRPLLAVNKKMCMDFLIDQDIPWIEDPSNKNPCFERVRVRQKLYQDPALQKQVLELSKTYGKQRHDLDEGVANVLEYCSVYPHGCIAIDGSVLWGKGAVSDTVIKELLIRAIYCVGGGQYRLGHSVLNPLLSSFTSKDFSPNDFKGVSLGGCDFIIWRDSLWIIRSWGLVKPLVYTPDNDHKKGVGDTVIKGNVIWDNRFTLENVPAGHVVCSLGKKGWQTFSSTLSKEEKSEIRQKMPLLAIYALPVILVNHEIKTVFPLKNSTKTELNWHRTIKMGAYPFSCLI